MIDQIKNIYHYTLNYYTNIMTKPLLFDNALNG